MPPRQKQHFPPPRRSNPPVQENEGAGPSTPPPPKRDHNRTRSHPQMKICPKCKEPVKEFDFEPEIVSTFNEKEKKMMEKGVCFGCIDWLKGVREWEWYCDACGSTGCVVDKCGDGGNGKGKGKEKEESDDEGDEVEAGAKGKGKGKGKERDESEDEGSGRLCDGMSAMGL